MSPITYHRNNTYFKCKNNVYKQSFGTPIRSKTILANYVMDDLLDRIISMSLFNLNFI